MSRYVPYVSDPERYRYYFVDRLKNKAKSERFYVLNSRDQKGSGSDTSLTLVTPTQGAIERAKSALSREKRDETNHEPYRKKKKSESKKNDFRVHKSSSSM